MKKMLLCLLPLLLLSACGQDEHTEIRSWMAEQSTSLTGRVPPLPQIKTFALVAYDNGGAFSPFDAVKLEPSKRNGANRPDTNRRREPLEAYTIESLSMVGMMMMAGQPVALIQADKVIYQARVGNYLGQNFGVITAINQSGLSLKELIEDANGDWIERVSTMELQEQEAKK